MLHGPWFSSIHNCYTKLRILNLCQRQLIDKLTLNYDPGICIIVIKWYSLAIFFSWHKLEFHPQQAKFTYRAYHQVLFLTLISTRVLWSQKMMLHLGTTYGHSRNSSCKHDSEWCLWEQFFKGIKLVWPQEQLAKIISDNGGTLPTTCKGSNVINWRF